MDRKTKLISAIGFLESEMEECQVKLASLRAEIADVENVFIGRRELLLQAKETLRKHNASKVEREATSREAEIARTFGIDLRVGDSISNEQWTNICLHRSR